jgi:transcription-repair coupling factor (superfamily II helicase)
MTPTFSEIAPERWQELTRLLPAQEGFPELADALRAGRSGTVEGAWGSSAALVTAGLGQEASGTLLVVLAHAGDLDAWAKDLATFAGEQPAVFPAWDHGPHEPTLADEVQGQRLRVLKALASGERHPPAFARPLTSGERHPPAFAQDPESLSELGGLTPPARPEPVPERGERHLPARPDQRAPRFVLTTIQALMQPVPSRAELAEHRRTIQVGQDIALDELLKWLLDHGMTRRETVELPGEFSRRGGILDVYPPDADAPYRLEFFGDTVESIRRFAPETQRSLGAVPEVEITALPSPDTSTDTPARSASEGNGQAGLVNTAHLADYLPAGSWVVLIEPTDLHEQGRHFLERTPDIRGLFSVEAALRHLLAWPSVSVSAMPASSTETTCHLRVESVERFSGDVTRIRDELDATAGGDLVLIACHNEAEQKRLGEVLAASRLAQSGRLRLLVGYVRAGFRLVEPGVVVLSDHELFRREAPPDVSARRLARRRYESRAIDSFLDLAEGDLVVHVSHGIARYLGMQMLEHAGQAEEHLALEFAGGTKLYVPTSKIDLVQKYIGGAKTAPELSKLGGALWQRRKERVQEAVRDLAAEMIELQATRASQPGIAYPPDTEWQAEFEATFPYPETPDQLTTLHEIKADMERSRPMDRLVCGDVGYGKTELAVRAAFKAMDYGKQVAVLVPTTVLAEQHFRTFTGRLAEFPFVVECLSRFRTPAEQKSIIKRLADGAVDLVIGTHRLLSADVQFKDLGLVIIDEEQRFGVEHKERLKKLRHTVDVLTLTATPIPRTLHLSLLGIRDISNLETPPRDRLAIETRVTRFDPALVRHAVLRELNRDGQVYFVHNRVYNIRQVADRLAQIVPEARISIAHGQMHEHELEDAMLRFVRRESDILVATTIIESGLDIPNVNTIFINQADQYGLADLHQLRGRVGRYKHRAYCYLLLDGERAVSPVAFRRLKAIEEFTELGAGFKIAMRDLEIRGAGNILGTQQSGHIAAVGYELYCQLLENAVRRLKNQPLRTSLDVDINLPWRAYLPRDYVPGQRLKIEVYRRLARVRRLERLAAFRQELADRFGPVPEPVDWLLRLHELRLLAARWQVAAIRLEGPDVVLVYRNRRRIDKLAQLSGRRLRVVDADSAYFRLRGDEPQRLYEVLKALLQSSAQTV